MYDVTAQDIADFTGSPNSLTDAQVGAALGVVRAWCRWHVAPTRTETVTVDGSGGVELVLPSQRVTSVTEIRVDGVVDPSVEWWGMGSLRRAAGFEDRPRLVEVDVVHGYDFVDAPELLMAVASIANRIVGATGADGVTPGVEEKAIGSFRIRWTAQSTSQVSLTMSERIALEAYRIPFL